MDLFSTSFMDRARALADEIGALPLAERIQALNQVRTLLHEVSPFRDEPVDLVLWVPGDAVHANAYNPNAVAPPEMRLLERSIDADGYTQPVVTMPVEERREVVDGFHRNRVGKESARIRKRVHGHLPVVSIRAAQAGVADRMAATIRHNRARGEHGVSPMSQIVAQMVEIGWDDARIAKELGMDPDELLRLKQITGIAALFKDREFSKAWE
jgi:ParB-like chromosome segregation protein Spo0J